MGLTITGHMSSDVRRPNAANNAN